MGQGDGTGKECHRKGWKVGVRCSTLMYLEGNLLVENTDKTGDKCQNVVNWMND